MTQAVTLSKKDFEAPLDVKWCPGCGDYSVLATVQRFLPTLGIPKEKFVFISGIGCSSRFPYYMNTYGFHTIHGRAPSVATGVKLVNPDLNVWVITGDGDALSIGGNHILHLLRRNIDVNVLLFNNRIYGLTKGQYSPTSEIGKVTKSSPQGSTDYPINPIKFGIGAHAAFIARTIDTDPKHMAEIFTRASQHKGTSFIEIYQNCVIFNDKSFAPVSDRGSREQNQLHLVNGKPLIFGKERNKGIRFDNFSPKIVEFTAGSEQAALEAGVTVYDSSNESMAAALADLVFPGYPVPMGVFLERPRKSFDELMHNQMAESQKKKPVSADANENLRKLFFSGNTWTVS